MAGDFITQQLTNGITLHIWPTAKFKTTVVQVVVHQSLRRETAAQTALLPMVLRRGTGRFPETIELWRHLDRLYGAELGGDVLKKGERHLVNLGINLANEKFLGGSGSGLLSEGFQVLAEALTSPSLEDGRFRSDYVAQEKDNLRRQIESLFNDKIYYSMQRCYEEMCPDEPFSVYKYGRAEDVDGVTPEGLFQYYRQLLRQNPIDLFVAGDVDAAQVKDLAEHHFGFSREVGRPLPPSEVRAEPGHPVRQVTEEQEITQGKLCLGFRTGVTRRDPDWYPLVVANGIIGGYAHSKLFTYVREKASLCYYAYSSLEGTKGLGLIYSGIEVAKYEQARDLIQQQVADTQRGEISDYEFEATKKALVRDLRASEDSPEQKINVLLDLSINGVAETTEQRIEKIQAVTREQAAEAAGRIKLDTIYFLRDRVGEKPAVADSAPAT